jgi:ABC-type uncharacterized transport system substrate-binding protein
LLFCGISAPAHAHPHVWTVVHSKIQFDDEQRITGIRHAWTFDEFYSAMAVQGLDTNGDGIYDRDELEPLAKVNIESLKDFEYFTYVKAGDKEIPLTDPIDYELEHDAEKGVLTLTFTLPLETPLDARPAEVVIDVYDPTFFVSFTFAEQSPVVVAGQVPSGCSASLSEPDAAAEIETQALTEAFFSQLGADSNFGAQFAQTAIVKCIP